MFIEREGPFQEIGGIADLVEIVAWKGEGVRGDLAEAAVVNHRRRDGKQFDTRLRGGFGLFKRFDTQHGELMLAALVQKVANSQTGHVRPPR